MKELILLSIPTHRRSPMPGAGQMTGFFLQSLSLIQGKSCENVSFLVQHSPGNLKDPKHRDITYSYNLQYPDRGPMALIVLFQKESMRSFRETRC